VMIALLKSDDDRVRLMAADKVFERAWGRPQDYDPTQEQAERPKFDPSAYSVAELEVILEAMHLLSERRAPREAADG
jgi:hypothetical protein